MNNKLSNVIKCLCNLEAINIILFFVNNPEFREVYISKFYDTL